MKTKVHTISFILNGKNETVSVNPWEFLIDVLRDKLNLTGTKKGCGIGECGSCTILLDGRPVNSCLTLAVSVDGKEVLTIEGLAGEGIDPIQKAFIKKGAVQCGFCTPGMILSAKALLDDKKNPTDEEIKRGISGNLCRCTGYQKIISAIREVALTKKDTNNNDRKE